VGRFLAILAQVYLPRAQPQEGSFSLKFLMETTLESESFEPLFNFLAFLVQKLRQKSHDFGKKLKTQFLLKLWLCCHKF